MDHMFTIAGLAVVSAAACLVLRGRAGEISLMVSLAGIVLILFSVFHILTPVLDVVRSLQGLSALTDELTAPMLKAAGVGILTRVTASVCEDAGEKTLGQAAEISGSILALYAGLPLLSSVIMLLEDTLG